MCVCVCVCTAIPEANSIHSYLNMNYLELKTDAVKEKQLLRKLGSGEDRPGGQSVLATSMQFGLGIEFERSDHVRRLRLFLSELLRIMSKVCVCVCVCGFSQRTSPPHTCCISLQIFHSGEYTVYSRTE